MQNENNSTVKKRKRGGGEKPVPLHPNPVLRNLNCSNTIELRFWNKVTKTDGCWTWAGGKSGDGYGFIRCGSKGSPMIKASKLSWMIHNGYSLVPKGMLICHSCDNPPCVNPDHLWLGTAQDNMDDKVNKQRHNFHENHGRTVLTKQQVDHVRAIYKGRGNGPTHLSIANSLGVEESTISKITTGKNWRPVL